LPLPDFASLAAGMRALTTLGYDSLLTKFMPLWPSQTATTLREITSDSYRAMLARTNHYKNLP
jgi:hypothetical protein